MERTCVGMLCSLFQGEGRSHDGRAWPAAGNGLVCAVLQCAGSRVTTPPPSSRLLAHQDDPDIDDPPAPGQGGQKLGARKCCVC